MMPMNSLLIIFIFSLPVFIQAFEHHRTYVHVSTQMTWEGARNYCREHHTDLAIFEDRRAYGALEGKCSGKRCWIGLQRDDKNASNWIWSNGERVSFTSWGKGEPNRESEKCGILEAEKWFDITCAKSYQSVCYDDLILVKEKKKWEEALEHCRALQTDPTSSNNHFFDLLHMHAETDNWFAKTLIQKAQTQEVWIGLCFLAGHWLWVSGFPLDEQLKNRLPVCPAPKMHCGTMSKTEGTFPERDCSEKRNFFCLLRK